MKRLFFNIIMLFITSIVFGQTIPTPTSIPKDFENSLKQTDTQTLIIVRLSMENSIILAQNNLVYTTEQYSLSKLDSSVPTFTANTYLQLIELNKLIIANVTEMLRLINAEIAKRKTP